MTTNERIELISEAVATYGCAGVWGMFSGGHDSLVACHVASLHPLFRGVVHINTGIGIEATRRFCRDTAAAQGWPFLEYRAIDCGQDYRALVLEHGFPGSNEMGHGKMYSRLKERPLRVFMREHDGRHVLVTGCRADESTRRMGNVKRMQYERRKAWCNPILDMTKVDREEYREANGLPSNPVVELLCKSGECLCGAFAKRGELDELALWYPEDAQRIRDLEDEVKAAGFPWGWEDGPPKWWREAKQGQQFMLDYDQPNALCWTCERRREAIEAEA